MYFDASSLSLFPHSLPSIIKLNVGLFDKRVTEDDRQSFNLFVSFIRLFKIIAPHTHQTFIIV